MMIKHYLMAGALVVASLCGYKVADWQWSAKWSEHMKLDSDANAYAASEALTKQQKILLELENAYKTAKQLQDKHQTELASANSAAERMRQQLDRIKTMSTSGNSSTLRISASAATDRIVFSELLIQSDRMAGAYAAEADRNRIAVISCNAEYNALRNANVR